MEIKFKGSNLSLPSTVIKVGDTLFFVGVNSQLKDIDLNSITGNKIISSVPSLDTVTCQLQTRYLNKFIKQHDNFTLVTVSRDLPFAQERICGSLLSAHSKVWSDYKYHDFGKKTNLIINEWQLLARSILVLDNDNLVVYVQIANPLESEPDYKALINFLETWNKH